MRCFWWFSAEVLSQHLKRSIKFNRSNIPKHFNYFWDTIYKLPWRDNKESLYWLHLVEMYKTNNAPWAVLPVSMRGRLLFSISHLQVDLLSKLLICRVPPYLCLFPSFLSSFWGHLPYLQSHKKTVSFIKTSLFNLRHDNFLFSACCPSCSCGRTERTKQFWLCLKHQFINYQHKLKMRLCMVMKRRCVWNKTFLLGSNVWNNNVSVHTSNSRDLY